MKVSKQTISTVLTISGIPIIFLIHFSEALKLPPVVYTLLNLLFIAICITNINLSDKIKKKSKIIISVILGIIALIVYSVPYIK